MTEFRIKNVRIRRKKLINKIPVFDIHVDQWNNFILKGMICVHNSIIQARDPRIHAVLGLRGKVLNIADDKKEFLKNKEIVEIINALGTSYWDEFDIEGLRYSKIITACDADSDGAHITCLVLTALLQLVPNLIREGKVYTSIMPLYGTRVKKQFVPIYNDEELAKYRQHSPNAKIQRYKGLGEMDPDQLAEVLLNPKQRRLEQVQFPDNPQDVFDLMTKAELKRELV